MQNHLLQVLTYLLMDPPLTTAADDQRDAKYRLLRAVRTVDPAEVVRGRYDGYLTTRASLRCPRPRPTSRSP